MTMTTMMMSETSPRIRSDCSSIFVCSSEVILGVWSPARRGSVGEHLSYRCLFTQSWKSSHPKGPQFIIWWFCFAAWIRTQQGLRIQTLCGTRPCLMFFSQDKDREQNQEHQRPKESWGLETVSCYNPYQI